MTTIELLEDRITELEKQIHGLGKTEKTDDINPENSIVDNILHINTLISTSVSGRIEANAVIKRLLELNEYMDPVFESTKIPIDAKILFLLAMEPKIRENQKLLAQLEELKPVLDTEHIKNVPELTNALNKLTLSHIEICKTAKQLNTDLKEVVSKYSTVMTNLSKTFIALDTAVTAAEIAAKKRNERSNADTDE